MKLRLIYLLFSLLPYSLFAQGIAFMDNPSWEEVTNRAKKEKKLIFISAYAKWCGSCKKMDAETFPDEKVAAFFNAQFINVKYDMEEGNGAVLGEKYRVMAYPSLLFIDAEENLVHKGVGFRDAANFLSLGNDASKPDTQYLSVKKKALDLSPADFLTFADQAADFEDEDLFQLTLSYLDKKGNIYDHPDLIEILIRHVPELPNEEMLIDIFANKEKILASGRIPADQLHQQLISYTLGFAIQANIDEEEQIDMEGVKLVVEKYLKEDAFFVFHYFITQYEARGGSPDKAISHFYEILDAPEDKVKFVMLVNAFINFSEILINQEKLDEALQKLDAKELTGANLPLAYLKDLVKAYAFLKSEQLDRFIAVADKMLASDQTPAHLKKELGTLKQKALEDNSEL